MEEVHRVAVTGGTGSFGSAFIKFLLENTNCEIVCISRGDGRQEDLSRELNTPRLECIPVDVTNYLGMRKALDGADWVVHAAALKRVPHSILHTDEYVRVNVAGTAQVLRASRDMGVKRFLFISSDKAVAALNPYGSTKAIGEHLVRQFNALGLCASVVRGGNVWDSSGAVMAAWRAYIKNKLPIPVYGPKTTRFYLPMRYWTVFCFWALQKMRGGEIFVPKLRAWRLIDLAHAFAPPAGIAMGKLRSGDKEQEYLVSPEEARDAVDLGWAYAINPPKELKCGFWGGAAIEPICSNAVELMTVDEMKEIVNENPRL